MRNISLKVKLLGLGFLFTVAPLVLVSVIFYHQTDLVSEIANEKSSELAFGDLDHIAKGVYALCQTQQEIIQENVNSSLNVADHILSSGGKVAFDEKENVSWNAVNQYTKGILSVSLPKMVVGTTWLEKNSDPKAASPIVDEVKDLVGGTCTIFQRMNDTGDMLRVSTNVEKTDGTRAIGTYIPRTNPNGNPNPVIASVLRGETFRGRAFVVNQWYITAYKPIFDENKSVVGVLYVGIPQESVVSLRQAIMATKVGRTGYVYVLDSKGQYVISKDGKRDGENLWNAKDADGTSFVQEICRKAVQLGPDQVAMQRYPWKNAGENTANMKLVRIKYFQPWDWVIGVGSYEKEFYEANTQIDAISRQAYIILGLVLLVATLGSIVAWFLIARRLVGRITAITDNLQESSQQVGTASKQLSEASQSLAKGASEQAASIEETSASIEEMSSMTKQNAGNATEARGLAAEARDNADNGMTAMTRMSQAIVDIKASSDETAKIIKTIDDIAFQTNLLALNAAVEAARAGEAGKGFAVVAEEVRSLAQRSADAARTTSDMIQQSVKNSDNGVAISQEVEGVLTKIADGNRKVNELVDEIAAASEQQSQGIDQVNTAVSQMEQVTQKNAGNAEESAAGAEELSNQAEELNRVVAGLQTLVNGAKATAFAPTETSFQTQPSPTRRPQQHRPPAWVASQKGQADQAEDLFPLEDEKKLADF